jgi:hypothetical protein
MAPLVSPPVSGSPTAACASGCGTPGRFLAAHPDLDTWLARPVPTRLADLRRIRAWSLISYLACAGEIGLDIDLLLAKELGGFGLTAERF